MIAGKLRVQTEKAVGRAIVHAVAPDNSGLKGLRITTKVTPRSAEFYLVHKGKIETFISTLDDVLACIQAAEETLTKVTKRRN